VQANNWRKRGAPGPKNGGLGRAIRYLGRYRQIAQVLGSHGFGYMVAADNWYDAPNAYRLWKFADDPLVGTLVYTGGDWSIDAPGHVSHANARPDLSPEEQFVCGAGSSRESAPRAKRSGGSLPFARS